MTAQAALLERHGYTALVTLNRPESGNAMNGEMREALNAIWQEVASDNDVRAVIMTGAGTRHFCTGADMKWQAQIARQEREGRGNGERVGRGVNWPDIPKTMWKPVFLAINGVMAGGGFHFLWQSDFAICSDNATFLEPHVSIGWVPVREMLGLATRAPISVVMRMALMGTSERLSAERAYQVGFVTEVVPQDQLLTRAFDIAEKIGAQAPLAVRAIKESMHRAYGLEWAHAEPLAHANTLRDIIHTSADTREGPRSFAEKRKPQWTGSIEPIRLNSYPSLTPRREGSE
jgi:enoyl-CoA hydratase/carnithine racemase